MTTPIIDFIKKYSSLDFSRLHMPGHKGNDFLGIESYDITEISGADSLYDASGIIAASERNASMLFGSDCFYSTEGSSHCIRAMIYLLKLYANPIVIAARNSHKAFISAAALSDVGIKWLTNKSESYLSGEIDYGELEALLASDASRKKAVYITSPDYLGNVSDIAKISSICKAHGALLCVDNAHGAYRKFLSESAHPIDLGADLCCDSAHKTLPVLTGGAYLHISKTLCGFFKQNAKCALSLFGSTSPSYLTLASLDNANKYISDNYHQKLSELAHKTSSLKTEISNLGYRLYGSEEIKIAFSARSKGYYGYEIAELLRENRIEPEFSDKDFVVLMLTPENKDEDFTKILATLSSVRDKKIALEPMPSPEKREQRISLREAIYAEKEEIDIDNSVGRIFGGFNIACPPAVPIVISGEIIDESAVNAFKYYGIERISVIK